MANQLSLLLRYSGEFHLTHELDPDTGRWHGSLDKKEMRINPWKQAQNSADVSWPNSFQLFVQEAPLVIMNRKTTPTTVGKHSESVKTKLVATDYQLGIFINDYLHIYSRYHQYMFTCVTGPAPPIIVLSYSHESLSSLRHLTSHYCRKMTTGAWHCSLLFYYCLERPHA
jgi:hypothetical protein